MARSITPYGPSEDAVLRWIIRHGSTALSDYRPAPSRGVVAHRGTPGYGIVGIRGITEAREAADDVADGSPFRAQALEVCWARCQQLARTLNADDNPSRRSALQLGTETSVTVDANPYFGLTRDKLDAVVRAAFTSPNMPEILLALWAKEGSHRMVTEARVIPQASSPENAKTIFRCQVYYVDLGIDHFIVTTRLPGGGDNVWDDRDSAAAGHEAHFAARVRDLVRSGDLPEDISAAINAELTVSGSPTLSVRASVKFYALSLVLVGALFRQMGRATFKQLDSLSPPLNYIQWNIGPGRFRDFLASADRHRREPAHVVAGEPVSIEQWALHTRPRPGQWQQARANAIRFTHYIDSYRPVFADALSLIKPGIEDLKLPSNVAFRPLTGTPSPSERVATTVPLPANTLEQHLSNSSGSPPQAASTALPNIEVMDPRGDAQHWISAEPAMPAITAHVRIVGLSTDPTPTTVFEWTTQIRLHAADAPNARDIFAPDVVQSVTGGEYTPQFEFIRGGRLTFKVIAAVEGSDITTLHSGGRIGGRNPDAETVRAVLADDTLRRIARQESGLRQFRADGTPLFSADNLGGAGIMQITPATADQIWNWRENINAGRQKLLQTRTVARNYHRRVQRSANFAALVSALNSERAALGLVPLAVNVPALNDEQVELDAIRGYNGFAGNDGFTGVLHEFRVARNPDNRLRLVIDEQTGRAETTWERVPVTDRPSNRGDPNYVEHVLSQVP